VQWQLAGCSIPAGTDLRGFTFGGVDFDEAEFGADVQFSDAAFVGRSSFARASFGDAVSFVGTRFTDKATFIGCSFSERARFTFAHFEADVTFAGSDFGSWATLFGVEVDGRGVFTLVRFGDFSDLRGMRFGEPSTFHGSGFGSSVRLGLHGAPVNLAAIGTSDGFSLSTESDLRLHAARLQDDTRVICGGRVHIDLRNARAVGRLRVLGSGGIVDAPLASLAQLTLGPDTGTQGPSLRDARAATIGELVLNGADISSALLVGTNLDSIRLDGDMQFCTATSRWTRSATRVLKEDVWIGGRNRRSGADLGAVESAYRTVRVALERGGNIGAANDFYFREMTLRRRGANRISAERLLLAAYGLMSGYGLRPARALALLLMLILASGAAYGPGGAATTATSLPASGQAASISAQTGRKPVVRQRRLVLYQGIVVASEQGLSIRQSDQLRLSDRGRTLGILLRILVPALIALSVFAVRSRVRRS
jgi:uncharacterized protein YjbI with pentapeptide repeats